MQINLAVFFGCCSVEHEVSIISAVQATHSIDRQKYNVIPVYVKKDGTTVTGDALFEIKEYKNMPALEKKVKPVTFSREKEGVMMNFAPSLFGKKSVRIAVAFPVVHGTNCEDGPIQGFFELKKENF